MMRTKSRSGFRGRIRAMKMAGGKLIVDHIIGSPEWGQE